MAKPTKRAAARKKPGAHRAKQPLGDAPADAEPRILEAARMVFIRRGTSGARMQEIAREAGVNQALLHYYFRSKQQLSNAVFEQMAARVFPALIQTLASEATLDEKIDRVVALYLENLARNPFLPGYLLSELHHHPDRLPAMLSKVAGGDPGRTFGPIFKRLGDQIDAAAERGEIRRIAVDQFVINLVSLCIFPFAGRPLVSALLGMDDASFARFIEQRKTELPAFFKRALRP